MPYDRKPAGYVPSNSPAPEPEELSAKAIKREREHQELIAAGRALAASNPRLTDVENYPAEAFASPLRRFVAFFLDCIVVLPTAVIVAWILGTFPGLQSTFGMEPHVAKLISRLIQIVLYDFYFVEMVRTGGQTWGMRTAGYWLVQRTLARPTRGKLRGRYLATSLSLLPLGLGLWWMAGQKHRRAWHDLITGTYALRESKALEGVAALANTPSGETARQREEKHTSESLTFMLNLLLFAPGMIVFFTGVVILTWVLGQFAKRRKSAQNRAANGDQA